MSEDTDPDGGLELPSRTTTRRGAMAAVVALGVGGLSATGARELLDMAAPLSGRIWDSVDREPPESVGSPYGEATVQYDDQGVPHIQADEEAAAYYAAGYVQGFDRLFQMDLIRRQMRGELSEIIGPMTLEDDRFHTKMDFVGAAEATVEGLEANLDPATFELGEAFVDGVNGARETEQLHLEFEVLDYEPDEWTLVDSMLMEKQISWGLTGSFAELSWPDTYETLEPELIETLWPIQEDHEYPIIREEHDASGVDPEASGIPNPEDGIGQPSVDSALGSYLGQFTGPQSLGSNSWVVGSEHTGGNPIVANDPHLQLMAPPIWYEMHVDVPDYNVRGVTFPGVPFVVIGHNEDCAWGFTNVGADVVDCYQYETDGDEYLYDGEWEEFDVEEVTIAVAGDDDETVEVKKTVHGPYIEEEGEEIAVAWTGMTATRTTEAIYEFCRSESVEDLRDAAPLMDVPTQNMVCADTEETAYIFVGKLPDRDVNIDETIPSRTIWDGSAGEGEWGDGFTPYGQSSWDGFVPFEEKPHVTDPAYLGTANQRTVDNPTHYIDVGFSSVERGVAVYDYLDDAVDAGETLDTDFHREMQTDLVDPRAQWFVDDLVAAVEAADVDDAVATAATDLDEWDREMTAADREPLVFSFWLDHYEDLVVDPLVEDVESPPGVNTSVIAGLDPAGPAFAGRSRDDLMVEALEDALDEIDDEGHGVWGDYHHTGTIQHLMGEELPFLNYDAEPADGSGSALLNFGTGVGASWRQIVEVGADAYAAFPGGNDGDWHSEHYDDQLDTWASGEHKELALAAEGETTITFEDDS